MNSPATAQTYTFGQLEQLWEQAGGSPAMAPIMAAIALAESGGNPQAVNANDTNGRGGTQTSWGLWQISNGTHEQPVPNILNPLVNAQQAVAKLHSQGLTAWGTYRSGAYEQFLPGGASASSASSAATQAGGAPGAPALTSAAQLSSASFDQLLTAGMETYAVEHPAAFGFPNATLTGVQNSKYLQGWRGYGLADPQSQAVGFSFLFVNVTFLQKGTVRKLAGIAIAAVGALVALVGLHMTFQALGEEDSRAGQFVNAIPVVGGAARRLENLAGLGASRLSGGAGGEAGGAVADVAEAAVA